MLTISEFALVKRINRRLAHEGERLCACADRSRWSTELGRFYIVDQGANAIVAKQVDIKALADELGALRPGEALAH